MQAVARRGDVLEVGEGAARLEEIEDLGVERALARVLEAMEGPRRDDGGGARGGARSRTRPGGAGGAASSRSTSCARASPAKRSRAAPSMSAEKSRPTP